MMGGMATGACEVAAGVDYGGHSPRAQTCGAEGKLYWSAFFSQVYVCGEHAPAMLSEGKIFRTRAERDRHRR